MESYDFNQIKEFDVWIKNPHGVLATAHDEVLKHSFGDKTMYFTLSSGAYREGKTGINVYASEQDMLDDPDFDLTTNFSKNHKLPLSKNDQDAKKLVADAIENIGQNTPEVSEVRDYLVTQIHQMQNVQMDFKPLIKPHERDIHAQTPAVPEKVRSNSNSLKPFNRKEVLQLLKNKESISEYDLKGANLRGADLSYCFFEGKNLTGADLRGADLRSAYLYGANLTGANLKKACLLDANLEYANLEKADLSLANLDKAKLDHANLKRANLKNAKVENASLINCDLSKANLKNADFSLSDLREADLSNAKVSGTRFIFSKRTGNYENSRNDGYTKPAEVLENERQLEAAHKAGYVQGVCECVAALGNEQASAKKLLTEMNVNRDMAKKFANPQTFKALENGIFAQQKQEQKLEQSHSRLR